MDILSTKAVSEMLGVSEATVKRWADGGTLRCFRTPGGHRKFRLRDVKAFLADQDPNEVPAALPITHVQGSGAREHNESADQVRALALAGDVDGLVSFVAQERLAGSTLAQTFDRSIAPAMHDIGEGWARGSISAAQEHVASSAVGDMIARIKPLLLRSSRDDKGRAICACLGQERHDLGLRTVSLVLTAEGYATTLLGGHVPAGDLAIMIAASPPAILALSASPSADAHVLRGDLAIVASAAVSARTRVIVGGQGFSKIQPLPNHVERYTSLQDLQARAFRGQSFAKKSGRATLALGETSEKVSENPSG